MDWELKKKGFADLKVWLDLRQCKIMAQKAKALGRLPASAFPELGETKDYDYRPSPEPKGKSVFTCGVSFAKGLEKRGFKLLGSGAFSRVYAKDGSDRVLKVTRTPTDGWINYINWASKKGYAGSYAPKVFSYKYFKTKVKGGQFSVAVVERLEQTIYKANYKHDAHAVHSLLHMAANDNQMARTLVDLAAPGILKFNDQLRKLGAGLDMHGGNFMLRKDGTLVFTDPVSSWRGRTIRKRMKTGDFSIAA